MAVSASALIENHPEGIFKFVNLTIYEKATMRLRFRVTSGGQEVDWTGCTVDYAQIDKSLNGAGLITLNVTLEAGGWVKIEGQLTQMVETLVDYSEFPEGMPAILTVRLKDSGTYPFYLVAPSQILIKNAPGVTT